MARRCRLLRSGRGQRLEPLLLVNVKPVVREANRFDLGLDGNVIEQFVDNIPLPFGRVGPPLARGVPPALRFSRRLLRGWLMSGWLEFVLEQ
jgi:hypothetical protein